MVRSGSNGTMKWIATALVILLGSLGAWGLQSNGERSMGNDKRIETNAVAISSIVARLQAEDRRVTEAIERIEEWQKMATKKLDAIIKRDCRSD